MFSSWLPLRLRMWLGLQKKNLGFWPPVGRVRFGSLRRLAPISRKFGYDRGSGIDRYYIEKFLADYARDIQGRVLEIGDDTYTRKFGGDRVLKSDVLSLVPDNSKVTIVADLTCADHLASDTFNCIIFTQTLQEIYAIKAAVSTLYRILQPGGVLLTTLAGISQISRFDLDRWGDYWRFTSLSAKKLFREFFPDENLQIQTYGNVFSATALLYGLAVQDLKKKDLDYRDPDYEVIITVRAVKP